jgi:hypothetical protein
MKRLALAPFLSALLGCSSPYKMTPEVERLRQEMAPQRAAAPLESFLSDKGEGHGVAASNTVHVVRPQTVLVTPEALTLTIRPRTVEVRTVGGSAQTQQGMPGDEQAQSFAFEDLKRISVAPNERGKLMGVIVCTGYETEYCVQFWYGWDDFWIAVAADDLNRFLAAVTLLAPAANVVE